MVDTYQLWVSKTAETVKSFIAPDSDFARSEGGICRRRWTWGRGLVPVDGGLTREYEAVYRLDVGLRAVGMIGHLSRGSRQPHLLDIYA